jgi:hypothetical protein
VQCEICKDESPFNVMRIPFQCSCYKKNGNYSVLNKDLWEEKKYPESLQKFYKVFNQPERLNPETPKGDAIV